MKIVAKIIDSSEINVIEIHAESEVWDRVRCTRVVETLNSVNPIRGRSTAKGSGVFRCIVRNCSDSSGDEQADSYHSYSF